MKLSTCEKSISGSRFFSAVCIAATALMSVQFSCMQYDVTEHEIRQNLSTDDSLNYLEGDSLSALPPPVFDSSMEVFDHTTGYDINLSAAVFMLDVPGYDAAKEHALDKLYPSVSQAVAAVPGNVLPSINVAEAKAKQFNDGLYAALDLSYYRGINSVFSSHVSLVKTLYHKLTNDSAKAFIAAGLSLSDSAADGYDAGLADRFLSDYLSNEVRFKPIGFYTWNTELEKLFKFMRFFQRTFAWNGMVADIVSAVRNDSTLAVNLRKVDWFYSTLTNSLSCVSIAELAQSDCELSQQGLMHTADSLLRPHREVVAFFPPSTSVETELFNALYPMGVPPDADMMNELIRAIQSGTVDLTPKPETGWYGRQVYALETFLLPSKGEEHSKLLLSGNYKKRLLEAFKAIITTQRETHVRQLDISTDNAAIEQRFVPALRVEPGCTYFLRTALAYAFLKEFLASSVGRVALQSLHGLTEKGTRRDDLWSELEYMRALFHGLYLVSAGDIGMKPAQSPAGWPSVSDKSTAGVWLQTWMNDPDLAADARVAVPIYAGDSYTMMWGTLGIRLCHLYVAYAVPPRFRSADGRNWNTIDLSECDTAKYLIPVLEFGEFRLSGKHVLTRQEFRSVCDQYPTKEAIIGALQNY